MATSLAGQLAQIAAKSKSILDVKTQKAGHSKSLLFEPRVAATQTFPTIYATCFEGFEELCRLDGRFGVYGFTLFSEQSQHEDRMQLTAGENAELDKKIESFVRLVAGRLRLMPAVKSLEWLVRRFRYGGVYIWRLVVPKPNLTLESTSSTRRPSSPPSSPTTRCQSS